MTDIDANPLDFTGRNVAVIGGTSGINLGIARCFARQGANLALAGRSPDKLHAALDSLAESPGHHTGATFDVREPTAVQAGLEKLHRELGSFHVLVSGAAGNFPAPALGMSSNGFKAVVDIDLVGTFNVLTAAYPYLVRPGASVINISAPQALAPMAWQIHVCAAKAGVDMVTRVLALEWGPAGVRVNSIVPGPIAGTEGMKRLAPTSAIRDTVTRSVPLGRDGDPEDIGRAALFLASPLAGFVNGAVLPVDGGWSLGGASAAMAAALEAFQQAQAERSSDPSS